MSRIRGADTTPEVALRAKLEARGLTHDPTTNAPAGRPDIVIPTKKVAIFIDGCFWHGCPLHYARPRTRGEFWSAKLVTNLERDARISVMLTEAGWTVIRLWEHEVVEDLDQSAIDVERIVHEKAAATWPTQRRVRRVVETSERVERREYVLLREPAVVIDATEGPRVTAKARTRRR